MPHAQFVHLRVHTAYSLSEGAIKIDALASLCKLHRMPAVAITDSGNLFGALEFSVSMANVGVQPIIGCQIGIRRKLEPLSSGIAPAPDHLVLLAKDADGYSNLLKLVSASYLTAGDGEPAQISIDALDKHNKGLIALTGGFKGSIGRMLVEGHVPGAKAMLGQFNEIFHDRLYVEIMRHGIPEEEQIESDLIDLAYRLDLPIVATNDAYFAEANMYEAHDALLCISQGAYVSQRNRRRLTPEHRFKSAEEMSELFSDLPEAINNTMVIAQRCAVMAETREPILPVYPKLHGRNEMDVLRLPFGAGIHQGLALGYFQ